MTDHYEGSRKSGERIADLIEARRQAEPSFKTGIILRRYDLDHASTDAQERGLLATLEERGLTDAILSSNQYAGSTRESGQMKSEALKSHNFGHQTCRLNTTIE